MSNRKKTTLAILLVLLLLGGVWAWVSHANDAQVEKVRQMHAEIFQEGKPPSGPPPREKMEAIRQEMEKLTPAQREQVMQPMHERMQRMMEKRIDDYFALPVEQRAAYMDKEILEMEKHRKEWEANRPKNGQGPGGMNGPPPNGGPGGQQAGDQKGGGPGGRPPGPPPSLSSDAGKLRRNQMFDRMSPSQRGKLDAYFSDMTKRRIALGLPANPGPPGGGPPPGR